MGCSYARFNKKGGGGIRREIGICSGGIILHIHVGTITHTSGHTPRVGGRQTPSYINKPYPLFYAKDYNILNQSRNNLTIRNRFSKVITIDRENRVDT